MKYHYTYFQYLAICVPGLLIASTSVNAGSFRDFILDEGSPTTAQQFVKIPGNSKLASCLQCHDGSNAKDVKIKHADTAMRFTSHGSSNHPIGMSYDSYARRSPASYVDPAKLDSRIKLENGQVTCISCHEVKQANSRNVDVALVNNLNVMTNTCTSTKTLTTGPNQTRLCLSCHDM